jgi:hypothetical protein
VSFPLSVTTVENEYRKIDTQLGSSEASAVGCTIRGEHIGDQRLKRRSVIDNCVGGRVHDRLAPPNDATNAT